MQSRIVRNRRPCLNRGSRSFRLRDAAAQARPRHLIEYLETRVLLSGYTLTPIPLAVAGGGGAANSVAVLTPASTPFHGTPINVATTIEAEDFDNGGEGVAY